MSAAPFHRNAIKHNIRTTTQHNNSRIGYLAYALGCAAVVGVVLYMVLA